jgi:hypothetical protein
MGVAPLFLIEKELNLHMLGLHDLGQFLDRPENGIQFMPF